MSTSVQPMLLLSHNASYPSTKASDASPIATKWTIKLIAAAALASRLLVGTASVTAAERPNILFIYTDDQSHRSVRCYPESHDWVLTPNIDAIASHGVRFHRAYIGTWCMPSRATMLTGLHPFAIESMRMEGKYPGSEYDPKQCPFWPRHLRTAGYTTAQIGKWHTGRDAGYGRDWDYQAVWNRPAHPADARNYYGPQLISFNGAASETVPGYSTDNYTDWAVDFIVNGTNDRFLPHGRPTGKPWYLWLCYGAVHGPSIPAERHLGDYLRSSTPVPTDIFGPRPGKPPYLQTRTRWRRDAAGNPQDFQARVRKYHRCVRALDEGVGRLMQALRDSGQWDNTLVVYTSDQGFAWGQHGLREKWAPYDAALRVPLIVSYPPQIPAGQVCTTPVGGVDLVPTFFHYADVEPPWSLHGHDLSPLLERKETDGDNAGGNWPHPVMIAQTNRLYGRETSPLPVGKAAYHQQLPWYVSLTQGHYKYIRYLAAGEGDEFYDLESDPAELLNLAGESSHEALIDQYRTALKDELRRTRAPFIKSMPSVR